RQGVAINPLTLALVLELLGAVDAQLSQADAIFLELLLVLRSAPLGQHFLAGAGAQQTAADAAGVLIVGILVNHVLGATQVEEGAFLERFALLFRAGVGQAVFVEVFVVVAGTGARGRLRAADAAFVVLVLVFALPAQDAEDGGQGFVGSVFEFLQTEA